MQTVDVENALAIIGWVGQGIYGEFDSKIISNINEVRGRTLSYIIWLKKPTPEDLSCAHPALEISGGFQRFGFDNYIVGASIDE